MQVEGQASSGSPFNQRVNGHRFLGEFNEGWNLLDIAQTQPLHFSETPLLLLHPNIYCHFNHLRSRFTTSQRHKTAIKKLFVEY